MAGIHPKGQTHRQQLDPGKGMTSIAPCHQNHAEIPSETTHSDTYTQASWAGVTEQWRLRSHCTTSRLCWSCADTVAKRKRVAAASRGKPSQKTEAHLTS